MGPAVGLVLGIASLAQSSAAYKKQEKAQALQRLRSVRQAIRERQMKRAEARVAAEGAGLQASSAFFGGQTSLSSNFGSALGYSSAQSGLSRDIAGLQQQANVLSGLSDLAMNIDPSKLAAV